LETTEFSQLFRFQLTPPNPLFVERIIEDRERQVFGRVEMRRRQEIRIILSRHFMLFMAFPNRPSNVPIYHRKSIRRNEGRKGCTDRNLTARDKQLLKCFEPPLTGIVDESATRTPKVFCWHSLAYQCVDDDFCESDSLLVAVQLPKNNFKPCLKMVGSLFSKRILKLNRFCPVTFFNVSSELFAVTQMIGKV
jgi:hypothetical protein